MVASSQKALEHGIHEGCQLICDASTDPVEICKKIDVKTKARAEHNT